jgi:WD40 repeat protein
MTGHSGRINSVEFSPDGKTLITAGSDRTIRIWDAATLQQRFVLPHPSSVDYMVVSKNGNLVVSGDRDGSVRFWRAATPEEIKAAGDW